MKTFTLLFALLSLVLGAGCLEDQPGLSKTPSGALLRLHSAGTKALENRTNAVKLQEIRQLASSGPLLQEVLGKMAGAPYRFWKSQLPAGAGDQSSLIRPLLEDLAAEEAYVELRGSDGKHDFVAAVKVDDERARLWSTNLWQITSQWKLGNPISLETNRFKGWTLWTTEPRTAVMYLRAGGWVVVAAGRGESRLYASVVASLGKTGRPLESLGNSLVKAEVDWPKLGAWFPFFAQWPIPAMAATWTGEGEYVRTRVEMDYSRPLNLKLDPWKIPTQVINDPLVSFTAMRGIQSLLEHWPALKALGLTPLPNQAFVWGQPSFNGQTFIATPAADPTNSIERIAPNLPSFLESYAGTNVGKIFWVSNRSEILWTGLTFLTPFIRPAVQDGDRFLLAGLIPFMGKTNPPPPELFAQFLNRQDLVYYDWEITEQRTIHHRHYYRLADIIAKRQLTSTNALTFRWIKEMLPKLGNSITEITQPSPTRLSLTRKSHAGLTGVELVLLSRWMDSPGFPLTFEPPPPRTFPGRKPGGKAGKRSPNK